MMSFWSGDGNYTANPTRRSISRITPYDNAAISAAIGMVSTHAQTIRPATPHLTAENRLAEPTPTIEPVMVWVVDTGMPKLVARNSVRAPLAEAQKPPTGFNLVIRMPM